MTLHHDYIYVYKEGLNALGNAMTLGRGHCDVFLGKTLINSLIALSPRVQMGTDVLLNYL